MCRGGGEQVALSFHMAFPTAPIYTLCYQESLTFPEFKGATIKSSWLRYIARTDDQMKSLFFPLGVWAMQSHDLTKYDVVLMSGTHCAKYVKVSPGALVISYSFTPFRLAWEPMSYAQYAKGGKVKQFIFDVVLSRLRRIDFLLGQRPDYYVAMTDETAERLRKTYQIKKPIKIICPPVSLDKFHQTVAPKTYYLVVSRLEYYKRVDLVVEAFNKLDYPLVVVGKGVQAEEIKGMANKNIEFRSGLSAGELADVYANCRALVFPQHEDYGITPLEANAAGRPVIAYGAGGVLTTQIPVSEDVSQATAVLFPEQSVESLIDAVKRFEKIEEQFDPEFIRQHAEQFDESHFITQIQQFVSARYAEHTNQLPVTAA